MGFYFRKRVGLGPLALNFGKTGIGVSTGIRGLRAGISSHGKVYTSANIPGTGMYYRRYYAHHHGGEPATFAIGFAVAVIVPFLLLVMALAALVGYSVAR